MAIIYATALKNTRMQAVADAIDGVGGSPTTAGTLQIGTASFASILAEITLALPCGTVGSGILTLAGMPLSVAAAAASGTAAEARLLDGFGVIWASGITVGTSGTNLLLNSTTIVLGEPVTITSGTITHG